MFHKDMRSLNLHAPAIESIENQSTTTIAKLQVVKLGSGIGTKFPNVEPSDAISTHFGISIESIGAGKEGRVQTIGFLECVDTSSFIEGELLYSDLNGFLTNVVTGVAVATVIKSHADDGVIYVNTLTPPDVDLTSLLWSLTGNENTDEDINFLGTKDAEGLQFKTDDSNALFIDSTQRIALGPHKPNGFIHIKRHSGFNDAGKILDTAGLATTDTGYNCIYTYPIDEASTVIITAEIVGHEDGLVNRATLVRTGSFFRVSDVTTQEGLTQSDYTFKSDSNYNARFRIDGNTVCVDVKAANTNNTRWNVNLNISVIKNP